MVLRGPRQFLDKVVFMPVACRQFWGPDVQKTEVFRSCSSRTWLTCPLLRRQVQFLNKVAMPVVVTTGAFGFFSAENCGGSAVAVLGDVCSQFIDGCERPCAHAETLFFVFLDKVVVVPVVSNDRCAWRCCRCSSCGCGRPCDQAATSWGLATIF